MKDTRARGIGKAMSLCCRSSISKQPFTVPLGSLSVYLTNSLSFFINSRLFFKPITSFLLKVFQWDCNALPMISNIINLTTNKIMHKSLAYLTNYKVLSSFFWWIFSHGYSTHDSNQYVKKRRLPAPFALPLSLKMSCMFHIYALGKRVLNRLCI